MVAVRCGLGLNGATKDALSVECVAVRAAAAGGRGAPVFWEVLGPETHHARAARRPDARRRQVARFADGTQRRRPLQRRGRRCTNGARAGKRGTPPPHPPGSSPRGAPSPRVARAMHLKKHDDLDLMRWGRWRRARASGGQRAWRRSSISRCCAG